MVEPIPSDFIPERVFPEDFDPEGLFEPDDNRPSGSSPCSGTTPFASNERIR